MAMQLGGKGVQSEINVTPLIDVVLVLLIIFMVVTPTLELRFKLSLPETDDTELEEDIPPEMLPLLVKLHQDGSIDLNGERVDEAMLRERLRLALRGRDDKVAFFDAEDGANFGLAVEVMDLCRAAGAKHIGIVDPEALGAELPVAPTEPAPTPNP
ncbi:MAG: biopolymer transporter ExbD [Deltaproteobacteria bacterium]|nr:biopolymer transporter ExbD [Deltaproteobacteria bacterium]